MLVPVGAFPLWHAMQVLLTFSPNLCNSEALTEEQRALLIRLDRLEDGHLGDTIWRMATWGFP